MHPTSRNLLRLTPLSGPELSKQTLRLSPRASKPIQAKKTTRETFNETAKQILAQKENSSILHPENLRIEVADKKKTMFWRVGNKMRMKECEMMLTSISFSLHRYLNPKDRHYVEYFVKDDVQ